MARRGVMTALQAALAGIGGAAGGYVQQQELERKRRAEDEERKRRQALEEAGIRAEQRDILRSGGTQIAGMGEQVAGPVPSAIPLSGVGNAFAAAEQAGGPATSRGAMRQTVGGQTFMLPSAAESRAQALANALESARAERGVTREFTAEDELKAERKAFNALKKAGQVKGEFDPEYGRYVADEEDYRAIRRSRATQARAGEGDRVQRLVESTIATMVREGKPGYAGSRTAYSEDELKAAAQQIRMAATMGTAVAANTKGVSDTTQMGRSPVKPQQKVGADMGIASPEAYKSMMGEVDTMGVAIAPTRPTPAAPRVTESARPTLSPRRQRAAEEDLNRYAQVQRELERARQSTALGRSLDVLTLKSELFKIRRRLGTFGITPSSTP